MYFCFKRLFDVLASSLVLLLLLPFFVLIALAIVAESRGGVFYRQTRVGKHHKPFGLLKFRSMHPRAEKEGQLTVGDDPRVTRVGGWLRKYKIDEFPQLLNVIAGQMSIVGPRPEVPRYVRLYTAEQQAVLNVLPGLTDYASMAYLHEQQLLGEVSDPETTYIREIMPQKLRLNLSYVRDRGFLFDLCLIGKTLWRLFSRSPKRGQQDQPAHDQKEPQPF